MTKIVPLEEITDAARHGVITIGNFDGVHKGHAVLIRQAKRMAHAFDGPVVAVAFDPHPAAILRPDQVPPTLTWLERRAELLGEHGTDFLVVIPTNKTFLNLSATEFFASLVQQQLAARGIVEGPNFFFGRNRGGDIQTLQSLCDEGGVELSIAQPSRDSDLMISSTRIRDLISAGNMNPAISLLGHPHRIRGKVAHGVGRGKKIGFPTANLHDIDVLVPSDGVYGGYAIVGDERHKAAIHIGPNPTFDDQPDLKIEIHLLDYNGDLYDRELMVDFITRVRDTRRFDSPEQLVSQLKRDIESIRISLFQSESKA
ncbi:Riboflavin kinase [Planctomycetes bacterium CA13]|uniref:Riboflavin biosynthesis protein n=1 Tax=Novipirellula herctigrandis TaxID=2527986 RepID=A0A5C5Z6M7_9BACT|nr:Riboflavin kinase [Planctomycetes bacterium CA13]